MNSSVTNSSGATPRSAYIHVPFCRHRCGYCNFTLVANRDDLIDSYLQALDIELGSIEGRPTLDTLFLGGGTPSHLSPEKLTRLFETLLQHFNLDGDAEFCLEANPEDVSPEFVAVVSRFGLTRVSLGVQSFQSEKLTTLERTHSRDTVHRAVELLSPVIDSLSLDLIFASPGESEDGWKSDLESALQLHPDHVSTYGLTIEQGTSFWGRAKRGSLQEVAEGAQLSMYAAAIDRLTAAGFDHYEISNFARPGHRCRHNVNYWSGGLYFAAGPGAARYVADERQTNHRSTTTYLRRVLSGESPVAERDTISQEERARECLVFGLRRIEGVSRTWFQSTTGKTIEEVGGPQIERFVDQGFLSDDGERVQLTRNGVFISDSLWPELL